MKRKKAASQPQTQSKTTQDSGLYLPAPSRRSFLRTAAGAGLALASSPLSALADHHGHPSPNSISYLDRRMYIRNMEVLAHFGTGDSRHGKMQMMSAGSRRYIFQQGDVVDVSDVRKPTMFNKGGFEGGQVQVAYNKSLKKWILMTGAQTPITDSTPEAPMGKYDDPHLDDKRKNYKGLRGVRFYDASDPSKIVKLSEFSTGATGQGTHRNYYDGGKYAYLDTAPDETFIHQPSYFRELVNGNMIVDASDPASAKEVSMWWVPGSRKGEEAEYNKWIWSKLVRQRLWRIRLRSRVCTAPCMFPRNWKTAEIAATAPLAATASSFSISLTPRIRKRSAALNLRRNIPAWASLSTPSIAESSTADSSSPTVKLRTPTAIKSICRTGSSTSAMRNIPCRSRNFPGQF